MRFLRFRICFVPCLFLILVCHAGGQTPGQAPATPQTQPSPQTQAPAPTPAPKSSVPDYPDPRTFTLGVFYWFTGPGTSPSIYAGRLALDNETLTDLGRAHRSPGVEASFPISRTGELRFEYDRISGDANQTAAVATDLFGTQFNQGDYLATQYKIQRGKLYLDDLLFPHKFPVAKFRLKSLWEVQWVQVKSTIDAPRVTAGETGSGTDQIVFPTFGLAAEYALSPHILLRADASGFGLYHKADIWDADATVSWRRGQWEIVGGGKAFHFKTSPNKTEYVSATTAGAFVGLRWHWSL